MSEGHKLAAWTAFGAIGGGALGILIYWLFCLAMNVVIEGDHFQVEQPLRSFALYTIMGGTIVGGSGLWNTKRRWWATLVVVAGCAMAIGFLP